MATTGYTPDNTRSSVIVILFIAAAVALIAVLIGLSDKPEVEAIGVVAERVPANTDDAADSDDAAAGASQAAPGFDAGDGGADQANDAAGSGTALGGGTALGDTALGDAGDGTGNSASESGAIDATPIPIPTSTPEPTAEIAAAVEPTALPDQLSDEAGSTSAAAGATFTPGTITGAFFTRPDEDEGAQVQGNELSLTLNEDGTGAFTGTLDMTMADATQITLAVSGPIRWTTAQPPEPQVAATVMGTYSFDSQIDLDDVTATDAELTISSLGSGSGSLCFPRCFGFTFTPQTGF